MHKEATSAIQQHILFDPGQAKAERGGQSQQLSRQRNTIFQSCLRSDHLPTEEKRIDRLAQEAFTIVVAGGEATARVLAIASFHIIENKHRVLKALKMELETAFPDPNIELDLKTLERLPWLVGVPIRSSN
jgi:hypothetical protein